MNRPITNQERAWLIRGLQTLRTGEQGGSGAWKDAQTGEPLPPDERVDPSPYLAQINELRVVGKCECGDPNCHTVKFQRFGQSRSVAFATHHTEDGRLLIICKDKETRMLSELEII